MSSSSAAIANNANIASASASKKSFCKVCCDAGKSELEYTNHCVKNNTGKVICPILLSQLCRYCSKNGHTVSYCPVMAKNKKRESYLEKSVKNSVKKDVKKSTLKNKFQVFESDSEEEEEEEERDDEKEEIISEHKITYASVCAANKISPVKTPLLVTACPAVKACKKPTPVNWADYSSDDDYE